MSHRGPALRQIADPFVIAPPAGAKVRTRLFVDDTDRAALEALGRHLDRSDEVAAQATGGAIRYDITYDAGKDRWYIDASWSTHAQPIASLEQLRRGPVVAVDPAYTSKWGVQHWLCHLRGQYPQHALTGHHAASVAIGRRGLGQRLRRRGTSARTSPVDGERATASASEGGPILAMPAALAEPATSRELEPRNGTRRPSDDRTRRSSSGGSKTTMPISSAEASQETQDRSGPPAGQDSLLCSV